VYPLRNLEKYAFFYISWEILWQPKEKWQKVQLQSNNAFSAATCVVTQTKDEVPGYWNLS